MDVAQFVVTSVIALVGLWLAQSLRRQQRIKVAELRIASYRELWGLMGVVRVARGRDFDPHESPPLSRAEALDLYDKMTQWYFGEGRGMLLTNETKDIYLEAKTRLGNYARGAIEGPAEVEGLRRVRELSLLRTQMKNDVGILGVFFYKELNAEDREFLAASAADERGNPDPDYPAWWHAHFRPWPKRPILLTYRRLCRVWRRARTSLGRRPPPVDTPGSVPTGASPSSQI